MDFLKELSTTIIIGAYTIIGLELVLFNAFGIDLTGYIRETLNIIKKKVKNRYLIISNSNQFTQDEENQEETRPANMPAHYTRLVIFICLCFGTGIFAENLSYSAVDKIIPLNLSRFDMRINSLVKDTKDINNLVFSPLAKDLAKNELFREIDNECGQYVEEWIKGKTKNITKEEANNIKNFDHCKNKDHNELLRYNILGLFYRAKNTVYDKENYYDELKKLQFRSDFTRAIGVISFFYVLLSLIIILILAGIKLTKIFLKKYFIKMQFPKITNLIFTVSLLSVLTLLSIIAYESESIEYNKRVFGYFSTMQFNEKNKINQTLNSK